MRKWLSALAFGLAIVVSLWFGLAAFGSPSRAPARTKSHSVRLINVSKHATTQSARAGANSKASPSTGSGKSTIRSSSGTGETDATGESGSENGDQSTTENDTHEDPDGVDVNHECPPNCDTANGEVP